jgi:DNA-binding winged helix-turn-helix (wHTH) protein
MGAVAKNPISQLTPAAAQPVPRCFLNDSLATMRVIDLNEAQHLSQFVAVVVLVPAPTAEDRSAPSKIPANKSLSGVPSASKLLELFNKSIPKSKAKSEECDIVFGDVKVSFSSMEASRKGEPVTLTALEFKTLKYLAQNARRVISRDELLNEVWGYENYPCTRTVDNLILRLRRKLEKDPSRPIHFRTVHGAGYKFLPLCFIPDRGNPEMTLPRTKVNTHAGRIPLKLKI